ncbi:Hint domain-containing protein [Tropicimonas sp. S265A]|uniref:Hint domain-containing protein n=1 Tax=Tropicimonas sp. S265A TaxID=3415134 RepID=UPI003C79E1F4
MAIYSYIGYAPSALTNSGGTFRVSTGYDPSTDRVNITVDDAAGGQTLGNGGTPPRDDLGFLFDGDRFDNEDGDDLTQTGVVTELDGTPINSGRIYLEQGWTLTASGQPTITVYRVEIEGAFVGYIPSQPLAEGVIYNASQFNVTPANAPDTRDPSVLTDVPCFVAGTLIQTPDGDVPVEALRPGALVSCADGAVARVAWAGSRAVLPAFLADHGLWPIRISKGALGHDLPRRDLWVSPNHRLALSGALCELLCGVTEVLVPAKFLLPLDGVETCRPDGPVVYCHLLFDAHRIVLAEGAPSESLHPGDIALGAFHAEAREEVLTLFPELESTGLDSYGPTAAKVLRRPEARVLVEALRSP